MTKREIKKAMEDIKTEMFRAGINYETICDFSAVIGKVEREYIAEEYKETQKDWARFAAYCRGEEVEL